jgi:translocation and assembly module TamB
MMFPEYGVELSDITLTGRSTSNDIFEVNGRARSGDGTFTINSSFLNDEDAGPAISVAIQGDNIELINIPEVRAHAATDLTLDITREKNGIEGKVEIKNSLVNLDEIRETPTLSPDVIMADEAVDENKPARTEINLSISLGDNVRIKGQGISGRLSGDVTMVSSENGELIGNGEIRIVDGKYSAYGQSLEIQEGRVIFSNYPMDNPELRIRAIRRINSDITAGLTVTGFFSNPQVSLISTPSMADEEILSYIVFGRPLASLTSGEGTNLIGAATALGVKNSGLITQSLSSTFGLDQLELTSDADGQNASVTVGKYVTPKIYISYIIGLLESVNTARILYNISESWSLEAKSSNESMGVDLLYRIEK